MTKPKLKRVFVLPDLIAHCWYCRKDTRITYVEHRDAYGCLTCEKMFYGTDRIRNPEKYQIAGEA